MHIYIWILPDRFGPWSNLLTVHVRSLACTYYVDLEAFIYMLDKHSTVTMHMHVSYATCHTGLHPMHDQRIALMVKLSICVLEFPMASTMARRGGPEGTPTILYKNKFY